MSPGGWGTPRRDDPKPPPPPDPKVERIFAEFAACGFPQPGRKPA